MSPYEVPPLECRKALMRKFWRTIVWDRDAGVLANVAAWLSVVCALLVLIALLRSIS